MGSTVENFCLRWNDFQSNVVGSFRELRKESDFFDVTLATADSGSRCLQAHRVILSACSNYFKQVLRQQSKLNRHPHPFIFLKGVSHQDLVSVVDFMYHGEVNVAQDDLSSFLAVAEELQIKGLTSTKDGTNGNDAADEEPEHEVIPPPPKKSRKILTGKKKVTTGNGTGGGSGSGSSEDTKDVKDDFQLEDLETALSAKQRSTSASKIGLEDDDDNDDDEVSGIDEFFSDAAGLEGSSDTSRDFLFPGAENINQFIRTLPVIGGGYEYECALCGHISKDRSNLKKHIKYVHCGTVVTCKYCLKTYKHKGSLNAHLKSGCSAQKRQQNNLP